MQSLFHKRRGVYFTVTEIEIFMHAFQIFEGLNILKLVPKIHKFDTFVLGAAGWGGGGGGGGEADSQTCCGYFLLDRKLQHFVPFKLINSCLENQVYE